MTPRYKSLSEYRARQYRTRAVLLAAGAVAYVAWTVAVAVELVK
jgi:hypothetical protein